MKGYPKWFSARLITFVVFILSVTGVLLVPTALEMRFEMSPGLSFSGEPRIYAAALHLLVALIAYGILGALAPLHMRSGLRKKKSVRSGILQLIIWLGLGFTGIGLYYLSSPAIIRGTSFTHILLGALLLVAYLYHAFQKREN